MKKTRTISRLKRNIGFSYAEFSSELSPFILERLCLWLTEFNGTAFFNSVNPEARNLEHECKNIQHENDLANELVNKWQHLS